MNKREQAYRKMLLFARAYVAKAVADELMQECAMSPNTALRRIDDFLAEMEATQ